MGTPLCKILFTLILIAKPFETHIQVNHETGRIMTERKEPTLERWYEIEDDIPGFPLLSRIRGPYHDVNFENSELDELRSECLRAQMATSNVQALQGLQMLIEAGDQARKLGLSIYFVSN